MTSPLLWNTCYLSTYANLYLFAIELIVGTIYQPTTMILDQLISILTGKLPLRKLQLGGNPIIAYVTKLGEPPPH